jgi:hypothetical protein
MASTDSTTTPARLGNRQVAAVAALRVGAVAMEISAILGRHLFALGRGRGGDGAAA